MKKSNENQLYADALYEHFINMGLPIYKAEMKSKQRKTELLECPKCKKETEHYTMFSIKECKECGLISHKKVMI